MFVPWKPQKKRIHVYIIPYMLSLYTYMILSTQIIYIYYIFCVYMCDEYV